MLRDLVGRCWSIEVEQRPQCSEIVQRLEADSSARRTGHHLSKTPNRFWLSAPGTTSDLNQLKDLLEQIYYENEVDIVPDFEDPPRMPELQGILPPSQRVSMPEFSLHHPQFSRFHRSPSPSSSRPWYDTGMALEGTSDLLVHGQRSDFFTRTSDIFVDGSYMTENDFALSERSQAPPPATNKFTTPSQQSSSSESLSQPPRQESPGPQHQNLGVFSRLWPGVKKGNAT